VRFQTQSRFASGAIDNAEPPIRQWADLSEGTTKLVLEDPIHFDSTVTNSDCEQEAYSHWQQDGNETLSRRSDVGEMEGLSEI